MVESFILKCLSSLKIKTVFRHTTLRAMVNYKLVEFVTTTDDYFTAQFLYNDTTLFVKDKLILLGEGDIYNMRDIIKGCLKKFSSRDEFFDNRVKIPSKDEIDNFIQNALERVCRKIGDVVTNHISVREVRGYATPALMIFITLNYDKRRQSVLKLFLGQSNIIDSSLFYGDKAEYEKFANLIQDIVGRVCYVK